LQKKTPQDNHEFIFTFVHPHMCVIPTNWFACINDELEGFEPQSHRDPLQCNSSLSYTQSTLVNKHKKGKKNIFGLHLKYNGNNVGAPSTTKKSWN